MTSKLTREELRKRAKENINNLRFASKQRAFESARKEILADLQLAEYALEAMESEPYGFTEGERFGMVLEPRQWPAPKDGEPQLHIKEQPGPDIDTLRHAFETEEREETGGFNLHKSGIDYVDKSTQAQLEAWLVCRAAMLQAGISAVIPDGYVMVPVKPTMEILDEFDSIIDYGAEDSEDAWRRLLAAAQQPQDEPQNIPEIIPGWIPVSERMPDDDDFVYIWPRPDFGVELHVGQYCECSPKGDGWYAQVYEQNYGIEWYPITVTHWMPLPADPQEVNHG
ncbi:DUF551 domain-containing protein [Raoultella ornithinolytica]|uniref:DUF551 domain-containing protein n=1 Tax=Raoultella ornithinolytica TaxID=54291 RepID=UPI0004D9BA72|nr:DUF551 domain-containing protein [Raoultella ornithinolytica]KDV95767.1 hypothetical protein AB00_1368 [Raoultella ornithinolytica 2-156-04_S1_C1]KDX15284.1 hypothetical protein AB28_1381 [Raoultella ornithinolytica 2-156-04_S1_C2]